MMSSTRRLMILLAALLAGEGIAGSAAAGFVIEGDMNSFTAILLLIITMGATFFGTTWLFMQQVVKGRESKNKLIRAFAEQLYRDVNGGEKDPVELLEEVNKNLIRLINLVMVDRAEKSDPRDLPLKGQSKAPQ